ncbi:hypothetical protein GFH48_29000 [Streptomyces fagopyri]|uniref:Uncharacterized protein n=1 Tax=Streptomyces fagopyri TaxID=2662397 RepID=A0A5Q0LJ14_9ACTN|nr:hypothetical protein GFH48_29000 [Streptomyces fagopyri]
MSRGRQPLGGGPGAEPPRGARAELPGGARAEPPGGTGAQRPGGVRGAAPGGGTGRGGGGGGSRRAAIRMHPHATVHTRRATPPRRPPPYSRPELGYSQGMLGA